MGRGKKHKLAVVAATGNERPLKSAKVPQRADPIVRINVPSPSSSSLPLSQISPSNLFPESHNLKKFLASTFRKKACHIKGAKYNFPSLDHLTDRSLLYNNTSSDAVHVWIKDSGISNSSNSNSSNSKLLHSIMVPPDQATILNAHGNHATYCRAPPETEAVLVQNFLNDLGIGCGRYDPDGGNEWGRGEVEMFVGTTNHLTDWHFDFQENFTIQLSGVKKWTVRKSTLSSPVLGVTPHYLNNSVVEGQILSAKLSDPSFTYTTPASSPDFPTEEIIVGPGDFWYFPAGMWHKVETIEAGVSMNISLMGRCYADIYCEGLAAALRKEDGWREVVVDDLENGKSAVGRLGELIKGLDGRRLVEANMIITPAVSIRRTVVEGGGGDEVEDEDEEEDEEEEEDGFVDISSSDESDSDASDSAESSPDSTIYIDMSAPCPHSVLKGSGKLIRNPLCQILKEEEINSYFSSLTKGKTKTKTKNSKTQGKKIVSFVVNINYAGRDIHDNDFNKATTRAVVTVPLNSPEHQFMIALWYQPSTQMDNAFYFEQKFEVGIKWALWLGVLVETES